MGKSHVSLDTKICIFCGKQFEVGIIDKKLKNTLEKVTITGIDFCPTCTKKVILY
jgi:DNA-directed RNA polymerase subunit RPC12/RpoP